MTEAMIAFFVNILSGVATYYICKWLDGGNQYD